MLILNFFKPDYFHTVCKKVFNRFCGGNSLNKRLEMEQWISKVKTPLDEFCNQLDKNLWLESKKDTQIINLEGIKLKEKTNVELGGGGCYPLLYFLTRYYKPSIIVETGVAAGFSSYSFLLAIKKNGLGKLYSSDFPYLRLPSPERYIGYIVPEKIKENWNLFINGDKKNLKKISTLVNQVDLFHYDSDKTYSGRYNAMSILNENITTNTIIIFDDIQDNTHFRDMIKNNLYSKWRVFEFENKFVGLIFR